MVEYQIKTHTVEETTRLAEKVAVLLKPGDVITLHGDLGVGKTAFTKGVAKGLGVKRPVSSPTFTIIKEYEGELPLYHMDVYRLEHSDEDIGFSEYFNGDGVSIIEWAKFIEDFLPSERLNIHIKYLDEHERLLTFSSNGKHYDWIIHELIG